MQIPTQLPTCYRPDDPLLIRLVSCGLIGGSLEPPHIEGDAYIGSEITSSKSAQWFLNGEPIAGETGNTLTVPETAILGDEISQKGSNVLTVIRIPSAIGINVNTELPGDTGSDGFRLPARNDTGYDCRVYWGDGTYSDIDAYDHPDLEHTYEDGGVYDIQISGTFRGFFFNNAGDKGKLLRIDQWGDTGQASDQSYAFYGCANLTELPDDMALPNLTKGQSMFRDTPLTALPDGMTLPNLANGQSMFDGSNLTALPDGMELPNLDNGESMFRNTPLTALPAGMTLPNLSNGESMFQSTSLTTLPDGMALPNLTNGESMFQGVTLTTTRYSQLLIDLSENNPNDNVTFHGGGSVYNHDGWVSRTVLVGRGWTITDGGIAAEITGTPDLGETLTSTVAGQWYVNGVPVEGETGTEFEIPLSLSSGDEIWNEWTVSVFVITPVLSGDPYQGQELTSTSSREWLINGVPTGVVGNTFIVPESVLIGDEITQAGSNVLEVIQIPTATVITVDTTLGSGNSFSVPTNPGLTYDCVIYWGDRTSSVIDSYDSAGLSHSYSEGGEYHIQIEGEFGAFYFNDGGDKEKLTRVDNWGENSWSGTQEGAFFGCSNLSYIDDSFAAWANTNLFYMLNMFNGCASLTSLPPSLTLENVIAAQIAFVGSGFVTLPESLNLESLEDGFAMFATVPLTDLPSDVKLPNMFIGEVMFSGSTLPTSRYSQLLLDLESGNSNNNVTFHGGNSKYNEAAAPARYALYLRQWTITDGGADFETPLLFGLPQAGSLLWSTHTGQWAIDGTPVVGETGQTFEVPGDVTDGQEITQLDSDPLIVSNSA